MFNVKPDDDTPIDVDGQPPTFALPLGLVPPGDTLNMDFCSLTNPPTLIVGVPGSGGFSFAPGPEEQVTFRQHRDGQYQ